jgi:hypothetical protein
MGAGRYVIHEELLARDWNALKRAFETPEERAKREKDMDLIRGISGKVAMIQETPFPESSPDWEMDISPTKE